MFPYYRTNIDYFYDYENENVKNWLIRFQNFLIVKGFKPHGCEVARIFPFFLRGVAQTWYYSLADDVRDNFLDLEKAFIFRFLSYEYRFRLREELELKRQGISESLQDYIDFIEERAQLLEIDDETKLFVFANGLRNDIKRVVLMKSPKSFYEAVSLAQHKVLVDEMISNADCSFDKYFQFPPADARMSADHDKCAFTSHKKDRNCAPQPNTTGMKTKLNKLKEEWNLIRRNAVDNSVEDEIRFDNICQVMTAPKLFDGNLTQVFMIEDKAEELYCVNTTEVIPFVNEVKITVYQEARELDEAQEKDSAFGKFTENSPKQKNCSSLSAIVHYKNITNIPNVSNKVQISEFRDKSWKFSQNVIKCYKIADEMHRYKNNSVSQCNFSSSSGRVLTSHDGSQATVIKQVKTTFGLNQTIWACILLWLILLSTSEGNETFGPQVSCKGDRETVPITEFSSHKDFPPPYIYEISKEAKPPDKWRNNIIHCIFGILSMSSCLKLAIPFLDFVEMTRRSGVH